MVMQDEVRKLRGDLDALLGAINARSACDHAAAW